jgi:hypothetical protein
MSMRLRRRLRAMSHQRDNSKSSMPEIAAKPQTSRDGAHDPPGALTRTNA